MYYVVYGFLWLVSLIPLRILYFISDGIYTLVFYVFKYRRKVVMANLLIAFPEKTEEERKRIAKDFYHNLIDTFLEAIKMITVPHRVLRKRVSGNPEVISNLASTGKSVQIHIGHNFNWEWVNAVMAEKFGMPFLGVYMPITNKSLNRIFYNLRSKYGTILLSATNMREDFEKLRTPQYVLGLAADQNPGHPGNAWWFPFFGKLTPFVKGPAKAAIGNKTAVIFAFIHKPKRGHYELVLTEVKNVEEMNEQQLTHHFVTYLEKVIRENPEMWLWSHRRWKYEWREEFMNSTPQIT